MNLSQQKNLCELQCSFPNSEVVASVGSIINDKFCGLQGYVGSSLVLNSANNVVTVITG